MPVQANVSATVVDARFCKPLDAALIRQLAREHNVMVTVEEGSIGGFASHIMQVRPIFASRVPFPSLMLHDLSSLWHWRACLTTGLNSGPSLCQTGSLSMGLRQVGV